MKTTFSHYTLPAWRCRRISQRDAAGGDVVATPEGISTFTCKTPATAGSYNTAIGYGALGASTTADNNTASGALALGLNTTGGSIILPAALAR
jgi:hypothetical protein